ncbi:MAG TPA: hypothetical protein PLN52_19430 [Opitutaceae bacterium]|nr:hypothetical protein [Opitutaceae bacterium]
MTLPLSSAPAASSWKQLNSLPDPVGFAGMAAGVLNGRLVATGGSQWDLPIWRKGTRSFNDVIFVLSEPSGTWKKLDTRLPAKSGHFASASTEGAIYLAGGNNTEGCLATAYEMKAEGDSIVFRRLPDLPKALGYAAGVVAGGRFFVLGGVPDPASKAPSREVWSLEIVKPNATWKREADLPGAGVIVPSVAAQGESIFLFGGMAFDAEGKATPSRAAYRLARSGESWETLPDLPEPRVGGVTPCPQLPDGSLWLIGGYAEVWGGAQREHPGFSAQTLFYRPKEKTWSSGPLLPKGAEPDRDAAGDPGPVPMVAAPAVVWKDHVVVVGGEVRIATRTPAVLAWPLKRQ